MDFGMMFIILLLGGSSNAGDLLDYTPTQAYWEMHDQRVVDTDTMAAVISDDNATATDKLMAVYAVAGQC